jgi:uncharacterized protein (DUF1800 family)
MDTETAAAATPPKPAPRKQRRLPPVDRRAVLGAALAGGAGVAAARLLGLRRIVEVDAPQNTADALKAQSGLDWVSPLKDDAARVAHLLRRTSFGYTAAELETAVSDGYRRTVDKLIETQPVAVAPLAGADDASQNNPLKIGEMQTWAIDRMIGSPTPFAERMTLFWHGVYTSDFRKVGMQSPYLYWQDLTWRKFFLRDLRSILYEMTIDPAMLRYLDLGQSSGANPNENFSRELLELFTLGSGSYTEDDVKAAAKALAGWREPRTQALIQAQIDDAIKRTGSAPKNVPVADTVKTGVFERNRAYNGPDLKFLGVAKKWDTQAVIDGILEQDAAAPFMVRKVVDEFVGPIVEDATVARLADRFRKSRYDMRTLMSDVLLSPEFTSGSYRSLVRSPIEFMVATAKALEAPQLSRLIAQQGQGMGQTLFDPPSVGGWPNNAGWISSNTMLARINFVTTAVGQLRKLPSSNSAHAQFLDSTLSPQTLSLLNLSSDDKRRWTGVLCCPEFQLK